jgi:hypothetical protein
VDRHTALLRLCQDLAALCKNRLLTAREVQRSATQRRLRGRFEAKPTAIPHEWLPSAAWSQELICLIRMTIANQRTTVRAQPAGPGYATVALGATQERFHTLNGDHDVHIC